MKKNFTARFPADRQEPPEVNPARWCGAGSGGGQDGRMTDRRPLGTGCDRADLSRTGDTELPDAPRARLAAERLDVQAATAPAPARPAGRRALGTGAGADGARPHAHVRVHRPTTVTTPPAHCPTSENTPA
ncbi:hypothetical protein ABT147_32940 [Streptomyces sp. NPDC001868]|uniref:hypothetical protein n=1 Tax=Streptomyces sp. NPDC001868 TaxID=3154401 RepID=UPI00331A7800